MKNLNVNLEYIHNSGFILETENYLLVFDYYKGDVKLSDKKTIVFVTHGHADHYNPIIFDWKGDITYVLSDDIKVDKDLNFVKPGDSLKLYDMDIQVFGSTDLGVSFLVSVDGLKIFHAGDLNWWYWENDTVEEKLDMEEQFKAEIAKIKGKSIDLAFFPVDPRLGNAFSMGGEYFIKELSPSYFVPMHFGDNFDAMSKIIHILKDSPSKIIELTHENHAISI